MVVENTSEEMVDREVQERAKSVALVLYPENIG